jgi:hypothetical protein
MRFAAPEWFLCAGLIGFLAWRWTGLRRPLRMVCLVLLLLFATRPQVQRLGRGLDLWVLADRSASADTSVAPHLAEWERILERAKGPDDRLFFVDYAAEAALRDPAAFSELTGSREGSQTALAANYALSQMAAGRACRLLALTDGFSTEPFGDLLERMRRQNVALDFRLSSEEGAHDFSVNSISAPSRVRPLEPFLVEVRVSGPEGEPAPYQLLRDDKLLSSGTLQMKNRRGIARFTDRIAAQGGHRYRVEISPAKDSHPGNNTAQRWIEVSGGPSVLLVSGYTGDPLAQTLSAQGIKVDLVTDLASLHEGHLAGARAIILNNVPAFKLPQPFLKALDFFVRNQGGGLLMTGGKASFACGGYFGSPIADLLPVSMELRQEQRKLATALAIEMDRSGSMGMPTDDGHTKIQLAGAGAARAVELLGPGDEVSVVAVDTEPHEIVPLCTVGNDADKLGETIRRIMSAGGGINVYTALKDAYYKLRVSPSGQRHCILLADANDALQEVGRYKEILQEMRTHKITVSVIGLGTEHDSGAEFLKDVAARGNGRIYFAAEAAELPAVFEQETVSVARSAFIEEPVPLKPLGGWAELAARPMKWPAKVDGYNLSYLRPGATAAAATADQDNAPLVAFWQKGAGRVAAISFPLGGEFSSTVRSWGNYGDFTQTLARWLLGEATAPGIALRTEVEGVVLNADLLYDSNDQDWVKLFAQAPPKLVINGAKPGEATSLVWERMEPGRYRATAQLQPGQLVRGAVQIGKTTLPFGPMQANSGAEWDFDPAKPAALKALATASGGEERLELASVWKAPRPPEYGDVRQYLLPLLLALFVLEVLLTRIGWTLPALAWSVGQKKAASAEAKPEKIRRVKSASTASKAEEPAAKPPVAPPKEPQPEADNSRRDRFRRAKRG